MARYDVNGISAAMVKRAETKRDGGIITVTRYRLVGIDGPKALIDKRQITEGMAIPYVKPGEACVLKGLPIDLGRDLKTMLITELTSWPCCHKRIYF